MRLDDCPQSICLPCCGQQALSTSVQGHAHGPGHQQHREPPASCLPNACHSPLPAPIHPPPTPLQARPAAAAAAAPAANAKPPAAAAATPLGRGAKPAEAEEEDISPLSKFKARLWWLA